MPKCNWNNLSKDERREYMVLQMAPSMGRRAYLPEDRSVCSVCSTPFVGWGVLCVLCWNRLNDLEDKLHGRWLMPDAEALALELAGDKVECPGSLDEHNVHRSCPALNLLPEGSGYRNRCDCHGTGKVHRFDASVRVPCRGQPDYGREGYQRWYNDGKEDEQCPRCSGRGWTPSLDFVTWGRVFHDAGAFGIHWDWDGIHIHWKLTDFKLDNAWTTDAEALLTALVQNDPQEYTGCEI